MLTSSGRHSIQTGIPTSHTREDYLLHLGKELAGVVSEEAIQKTVHQTRETASEPPREKARCTICTSAKDRKMKTVCSKCSKNVCQ